MLAITLLFTLFWSIDANTIDCKPFGDGNNDDNFKTFVMFARCDHRITGNLVVNGNTFTDLQRSGTPNPRSPYGDNDPKTYYYHECWVDPNGFPSDLKDNFPAFTRSTRPNHVPFINDGKGEFGENLFDESKIGVAENEDFVETVTVTVTVNGVDNECKVIDFATKPWYKQCDDNGNTRDITRDKGTPFCGVNQPEYVVADFLCAVRGCNDDPQSDKYHEDTRFDQDTFNARDCCYKGYGVGKYDDTGQNEWSTDSAEHKNKGDNYKLVKTRVVFDCFAGQTDDQTDGQTNGQTRCDNEMKKMVRNVYMPAVQGAFGRLLFGMSDWVEANADTCDATEKFFRNRCVDSTAIPQPVVRIKKVNGKDVSDAEIGAELSSTRDGSYYVPHDPSQSIRVPGDFPNPDSWVQRTYSGRGNTESGWSYDVEFEFEVRVDKFGSLDKAVQSNDCMMLLERELTFALNTDVEVEHLWLNEYQQMRNVVLSLLDPRNFETDRSKNRFIVSTTANAVGLCGVSDELTGLAQYNSCPTFSPRDVEYTEWWNGASIGDRIRMVDHFITTDNLLRLGLAGSMVEEKFPDLYDEDKKNGYITWKASVPPPVGNINIDNLISSANGKPDHVPDDDAYTYANSGHVDSS